MYSPNSAIGLKPESLREEVASLSASDTPTLAVGKPISGREKVTHHNMSHGGPSGYSLSLASWGYLQMDQPIATIEGHGLRASHLLLMVSREDG